MIDILKLLHSHNPYSIALNSVNLCVICFVLAVQMFLVSFLFSKNIALRCRDFQSYVASCTAFQLGDMRAILLSISIISGKLC